MMGFVLQKDLVCLANLENVELFFGLDWKRKFKSPSDFCFALKVGQKMLTYSTERDRGFVF